MSGPIIRRGLASLVKRFLPEGAQPTLATQGGQQGSGWLHASPAWCSSVPNRRPDQPCGGSNTAHSQAPASGRHATTIWLRTAATLTAAGMCIPSATAEVNRGPASTGTGAAPNKGGASPVPASPSPHQSQPRDSPQSPTPPAPPKFLEGQAFQAYSRSGQAVSWSHVTDSLPQSDVVLLGEFHDDAVAHALETRVWKAALAACGHVSSATQPSGHAAGGAGGVQPEAAGHAPQPTRRAVLSLEMFESDTQVVMDEWLSGLVRDRDLMVDARAWPNYAQDYHPMVHLAKQHGLRVVCANAPRRLVAVVGKRGAPALEGAPPASRAFLPPLPVAPVSARCRAKIEALMALARPPPPLPQPPAPPPAATEDQPPPPQETKAKEKDCPYIGLNLSSNFFAAQNLWDATMAFHLAKELDMNTPPTAPGDSSSSSQSGALPAAPAPSAVPRPLVVHVCGKAHVEEGLGIVEHLERYAPGAKVMVVLFVPARTVRMSPSEFQHEGLTGQADFVVLTDGTRSYASQHPV